MCLCVLRGYLGKKGANQLSIKDLGGIDILINILEAADIPCVIQSLLILKSISSNVEVVKAILASKGVEAIVKGLTSSSKPLKALVAETLALLATSSEAKSIILHNDAVPKLVDHIDINPYILTHKEEQLEQDQVQDLNVAIGGAKLLQVLSKSRKARTSLNMSGGLAALAKALSSVHKTLLIPIMGVIQLCATEENHRAAIHKEGMINNILQHMNSDDIDLQMQGAMAIFQCAENAAVRITVRVHGGLGRLLEMLERAITTDNLGIIKATTGALWKCCFDPENARFLCERQIISILAPLYDSKNDQVLINSTGVLQASAQLEEVRNQLKNENVISSLVSLLDRSNPDLLVNSVGAIGACSNNADCFNLIEDNDGIRLIWSLLKFPVHRVQAAAAKTICLFIRNTKNSVNRAASFVGGLELLVSLLSSPQVEVLSSVCAAITEIAKHTGNLAIMSDYKLVDQLASLAKKSGSNKFDIHRNLTEAVAQTCTWADNRVEFGELGIIPPLVSLLQSGDTSSNKTCTMALYELSKEPMNCISMHQHHVENTLLDMCSSCDPDLQNYAAECLRNVRTLAIKYEHFTRSRAK